MPSKKIILVCGVPGAGKTWVCEKLKDKFSYVAHDDHREKLPMALKLASDLSSKPLITECPFGERPLKEKLEEMGFEVVPVFVIEPVGTIKARYLNREKKDASKATVTRAVTIKERAKEWGAKAGSSEEILEYLKNL